MSNAPPPPRAGPVAAGDPAPDFRLHATPDRAVALRDFRGRPVVLAFDPARAYRADVGTAERALFALDRDGVVRWSYVSPVSVNPGADGILAALEALHPAAATTAAHGARP